MNSQQLREIVAQPESATLEFKRIPYDIDSSNANTKRYQRDELIKDILALANGNTSAAGKWAHLIIGVGDEFGANEEREIFGVGETNLTDKRILQIVNRACDPPLESIYSNIVEIDGKQVVVVSIPPTPHLHETTRKLETPTKPYTECVTFVRHNDGISVASAKERTELQNQKHLRFNETRNAPPMRFGAAIGAIVGAVAMAPFGEKVTGTKEGRFAAGTVGILVGGFLGGAGGNIYKNMVEIKQEWQHRPAMRPVIIFFSALVVGCLMLVRKVFGNK